MRRCDTKITTDVNISEGPLYFVIDAGYQRIRLLHSKESVW
jgi:hypothetical protein